MALSGWDSTQKLEILLSAADYDDNLTDYPLTVFLGSSVGKNNYNHADVFTELGANYLKIAVEVGNTGVECYVEVEQWDNATGVAVLHVKVPSISSSVDTVLWLYYDSAHADNTSYVGVPGSAVVQNVWDSNFVTVYHMSQDPSGSAPQIIDSTSTAANGTSVGSMTSGDLVNGLIGKGIDFDGSNDYIECGDVAAIDSATELTVECYFDPHGHTNWHTIVAKCGAASLYPGFFLQQRDTSGEYGFWVGHTTGGSFSGIDRTTTAGAPVWLAGTISAIAAALWINGDKGPPGTIGTNMTLNAGSGTLVIGTISSAKTTYEVYGIIDEVRISKIARSDAWLSTTYKSAIDNLITWSATSPSSSISLSQSPSSSTSPSSSISKSPSSSTSPSSSISKSPSSSISKSISSSLSESSSISKSVSNSISSSQSPSSSISKSISKSISASVSSSSSISKSISLSISKSISKSISSSISSSSSVSPSSSISPSSSVSASPSPSVFTSSSISKSLSLSISSSISSSISKSVSLSQSPSSSISKSISSSQSPSSSFSKSPSPSMSGWDETKIVYLRLSAADFDEDLTDFPLAVFINNSVGKTSKDITQIFDELPPPSMNDDFTGVDGSDPDSSKWTKWIDGASATITIQSNKVHFHLPSPYNKGFLGSRWKLDGDFDIQTDFYHSGGAGYRTAGFSVSRSFGSSGTYGTYIQVERDYGNGDYASVVKSNGSTDDSYLSNSSATSGKFRITRAGSTVRSYYWNGSSWTLMCEYASWTTLEVYVGFYATAGSNLYQSLEVGYDNFIINSGTVIDFPSYKIAVENGDTGIQCPVEVAHWNNRTETAILFVKVPNISSTSDTTLKLYYDSTHEDNDEFVGFTTSTPAQDVWDSNFLAVYHCNETPHISETGYAPIKDSTSNIRHMTVAASIYPSDVQSTSLYRGIYWDGSNNWAYYRNSELNSLVFPHTIESFGKHKVNSRSCFAGIARGGSSNDIIAIRTDTDNYAEEYNGLVGGTTVYSDNQEYYCALASYSSVSRHLCDNNQIISDTDTRNNITTPGELSIGAIDVGSVTSYGYGVTSEARFSNVARSDVWLLATSESLWDSLITYELEGTPSSSISASVSSSQSPSSSWSPSSSISKSPSSSWSPSSSISKSVSPSWSPSSSVSKSISPSPSPEPIMAINEQLYGLLNYLVQYVEQYYGMKLAMICNQIYYDVPYITKILNQYYRSTLIPVAINDQYYGEANRLINYHEHFYSLVPSLMNILEMKYAITEDEIRKIFDQYYDIQLNALLRRLNIQQYQIMSDSTFTVSSVSAIVEKLDSDEVVIETIPINFKSINIEGSLDQFCLSCDLQLVTLEDYLACEVGSNLIVTVNSEQYDFFIEHRGRSRSHGSAVYNVSSLSHTVKLDAPYADLVTGDLGGKTAKTIVEDLADPYTVDWQVKLNDSVIDWFIPINTFYANNESPMSLIKRLADSVGAIVQTTRDNQLVIMNSYPTVVNRWNTVTPAFYLTDKSDFIDTGDSFDAREGYNMFTISDQLISERSLVIEERVISETKKELHVYVTPWQSDFVLTMQTSGGDWVTIGPGEIITERAPYDEEDPNAVETVEFVQGEAKLSKPFYARITSTEDWKEDSLGSLTFSEDGTIKSSIVGQSLLEIAWYTKYHRWIVEDPRIEKVQFYVESEDSE